MRNYFAVFYLLTFFTIGAFGQKHSEAFDRRNADKKLSIADFTAGPCTRNEILIGDGLNLNSHILESYHISSFTMSITTDGHEIQFVNKSNECLTDEMKSAVLNAKAFSKLRFKNVVLTSNSNRNEKIQYPIGLDFRLINPPTENSICDSSVIGNMISHFKRNHSNTIPGQYKSLSADRVETWIERGKDFRSFNLACVHQIGSDIEVKLLCQYVVRNDWGELCIYSIESLSTKTHNASIFYRITDDGKIEEAAIGNKSEDILSNLLRYFE